MTTRLAAAMFLLVLAAAPAAGASSCRAISGQFDYSAYLPEVELVLSEIATLPGDTTILGGHYHDGNRTVHPALLVKGAGDSDWTHIPLPVEGTAVTHLTAVGTDSVWGVLQLRIEGTESAFALLRSRDGGKSWCAVPLFELAALNAVELLRFFDRDHGLVVLTEAPFGPSRAVFQTSDGGDTWERLWDANPALPEDMETEFTYPQDEPPPHAPVWRQYVGQYRITGALRIRTEILHQVIERIDFAQGTDWVVIERLERYRPTAGLAADR